MGKTKPTSIRFDEDKLNFVKLEEKIETRQKVVDFLLEKYWWEKRVGNPPTLDRQKVPREKIQEAIEDPYKGMSKGEILKKMRENKS